MFTVLLLVAVCVCIVDGLDWARSAEAHTRLSLEGRREARTGRKEGRSGSTRKNKLSGNIQRKWCKTEATKFAKCILVWASARIILKGSIWILDCPFCQHPRFDKRVVTKQRRNCFKMLLPIVFYQNLKGILSSRIYRQVNGFSVMEMILIIWIWWLTDREQNKKPFLKGQDVFALIPSSSGKLWVAHQDMFWVFSVAIDACKAIGKPLCFCWKADLLFNNKGRENLDFQKYFLSFSPDGFMRLNARAVRNISCERFYIDSHRQ